MEEMTETELLVRVNSLKDKHELLKYDILMLIETLDVKQKELQVIEDEYVKLIQKMTK